MSIKNKFGCTATRKIEEAGVVATAVTAAAARGTSMLIVVKIVKIMTVYTAATNTAPVLVVEMFKYRKHQDLVAKF